MGIPRYYRKSGENVNVTYDFYDLAVRTGFKKFYGSALTTNSGTNNSAANTMSYILTENPMDSDEIFTASGNIVGDGAFNEEWAHDFDTTFNMPQNIAGTATLNISFAAMNPVGTGYLQVRPIARLYKVSAGTSTLLGQATGGKIETGAEDVWLGRRASIKIPISLTHFKKGDIFRVTLVLDMLATAAGKSYRIYHDPTNRADLPADAFSIANDIDLIIYIPFRIDI